MSPAGGGVAGNPRYATRPLPAASPAIGGMKLPQSPMWHVPAARRARGRRAGRRPMGSGASLSLAPLHRPTGSHISPIVSSWLPMDRASPGRNRVEELYFPDRLGPRSCRAGRLLMWETFRAICPIGPGYPAFPASPDEDEGMPPGQGACELRVATARVFQNSAVLLSDDKEGARVMRGRARLRLRAGLCGGGAGGAAHVR